MKGLVWVMLVGVMLIAAAAAGVPAQSREEAALRRLTACYTRELGVTPRWHLNVLVVEDTALAAWGTTTSNSFTLEAETTYNLLAIRRDQRPLWEVALHEVLHVATGELMGLAWAFSPEMALVESERFVRQVVRWPWWGKPCR